MKAGVKAPAPSLIDRALARFGLVRQSALGSRATRRGGALGRRTFKAAIADRLTSDLFSGRISADQEMRNDLVRLRNRARTMVRDSAIAKRYCELFVENVVGEHGIVMKPNALRPDGNADTALNDRHRAAWLEWGEPTHCTLDGAMGWIEVQQAIARWEPMDGEVLIRLVDGAGPFGFQVQILDPDQLDETMNVEPAGGGARIRQGIEVDRWNRPVAYHVWEGHPSTQGKGRRERIPADDIIHLAIPFRPGTHRAPPWFHAAMVNINMLEGYLEAALVAARVAASASVHVEDEESTEEDPDDDMPVEMEPGKVWRSGSTVTLLDPKHPTTTAGDFHKLCARSIASGGGVAYTSLSGDLEAVNYSSIRAGLLAERDHYRRLQQRLIRYVCRRVHRRWLRQAHLFGALDLRATDLARAERVVFQPRGFPWVDPEKDINALRQEIYLGMNSRTAGAADRGRDFEQILEQIDHEERLAEMYDVDVSGVTPFAPEPEQATPQPNADEADEAETKASTPKRQLRIANG